MSLSQVMARAIEREIFPKATQSLVDARERQAAITFRWIVDDEGHTISRVPESLLDHTTGMQRIRRYAMRRFPVFTGNIDMIASGETMEVHDDGEMIVGDLALSRKDVTPQIIARWKHREKAAFRLMTRDYLKDDPQLKQQARDAYQKYQVLDPNKPEDYKVGLFAHLIDKVQASRFGMVNVFEHDSDEVNDCGMRSLKNILKFTYPLLEVLQDETAKAELVTFVTEEIKKFKKHGFSEITEYGLQALHAYLETGQRINDAETLDSVA